MDPIRKLMRMHKTLHPRDDVDRLHVSRKDGGIELISIEDSGDTSMQRLKDYIKKGDWLKRPETIQTPAPTEQKINRKQLEEKQLYGTVVGAATTVGSHVPQLFQLSGKV